MNTLTAIPNRIYRPALLGLTCDACITNPARALNPDAPTLASCPKPATVKFVITDGKDIYTFKRCDGCATALRKKIEAGTVFEILAEESL